MVYTLHCIIDTKRYIPSELRPGLSDDDDEVELHCIVLQQIHANPPFPQVLLISLSLSSTNPQPSMTMKTMMRMSIVMMKMTFHPEIDGGAIAGDQS